RTGQTALFRVSGADPGLWNLRPLSHEESHPGREERRYSRASGTASGQSLGTKDSMGTGPGGSGGTLHGEGGGRLGGRDLVLAGTLRADIALRDYAVHHPFPRKIFHDGKRG